MGLPASRMRFIALSATLSNAGDFGAFLGAEVFRFGEEFRPVALKVHRPQQNDQQMQRSQHQRLHLTKVTETLSDSSAAEKARKKSIFGGHGNDATPGVTQFGGVRSLVAYAFSFQPEGTFSVDGTGGLKSSYSKFKPSRFSKVVPLQDFHRTRRRTGTGGLSVIVDFWLWPSEVCAPVVPDSSVGNPLSSM